MFERLRRRAEGLLPGAAGAARARQPVPLPRADTVLGEGADALRYPA